MLENRISVQRARSWDDARVKLLQFQGMSWVFRGQRDANWQLHTSLERSVAIDHAKSVENYMLQEFKRRAFHYLSTERLPSEQDQMEWLALMQHHGAPTRLLDWTRSPYVAAFFALEAADSDDDHDHCAIWVIDAGWLKTHSLGRMNSVKRPYGDKKDPEFWRPEYVNAVFSDTIEGVFPVRPFRMHERLTIQQGLFIVSGDPGKSFETNLESYLEAGKTSRIWKIEIPISDRLEALKDLNRMNIHRATLFPGIDGFAQSLGVDAEIQVLPPSAKKKAKPQVPTV